MPAPAGTTAGGSQARPPKVLVTNDDGIGSPGLHSLVRAAIGLFAEVLVVAPASDQSGCGAAVGPLHEEMGPAFEPVTLPGLEAVPAYATGCPPALAVLSACLGDREHSPEIVLSGVNAGLNLGVAVLHSGTVGAALTAANLGLPAVAVNLDVGLRPHWETAGRLAVAAARWLSGTRLPLALNVNVPDRTLSDLAGVRAARLSRFDGDAIFGVGRRVPRPAGRPEPDSDAALVRRGFATVTVLHGLREAGHETGSDAAVFVEEDLMGDRLARLGL